MQRFDHLQEVSFRKAGDESKGSNPICDFPNYNDTIQMFLLKVQKIDGMQKGSSNLHSPKSFPTNFGGGV